MRQSICLLVCVVLASLGWAAYAEYRPLGGVRSGAVGYAPLQAIEAETLCISIDGVDWDMAQIREEYRRPWTWPEGTEESLRRHLVKEHRIIGLDRLSFADVQKIHAVVHEREIKAKSSSVAPAPAAPRVVPPRSNCPGGVCPTPRQRWFFSR